MVVVVPKCVCPVSDDVGAFEVGFRMKAGLYKQQALHVEYGICFESKRTLLATVQKHVFLNSNRVCEGRAVSFVSTQEREIASTSIINQFISLLHYMSSRLPTDVNCRVGFSVIARF